MSEPDFLKEALRYAADGYSVFPLMPKGKAPLIQNGFYGASRDPQQIKEWWSKWPAANIGIPTGKENGFFVIDVDGEIPEDFPEFNIGKTVKTSKGYHYYVAYPENAEISNQTNVKGFKIDVRGDGGYVVAPPSIHPNGEQYEFCS